MPHETVDENDEASKAAKRIQDEFRKLESIVDGTNVDLMLEAEKRRALRRAASSVKKAHEKHPVLIFIAETALVVATFGVFRHLRKKSS
jgi:hypothetical protein